MYQLQQQKIILLVGMMGVGKTSLGRILAKRLHLPFVDSDKEMEDLTHFSINELFARSGEAVFRAAEEKIMARLLRGEPCVLSSGGGAFLSAKTQAIAKQYAISIWLKADAAIISRRTQGRTHRPLVPAADNQRTICSLVEKSYPLYAKADITVSSLTESPYKTAERVLDILTEKNIILPLQKKSV